jgi:hypothetical protein
MEDSDRNFLLTVCERFAGNGCDHAEAAIKAECQRLRIEAEWALHNAHPDILAWGKAAPETGALNTPTIIAAIASAAPDSNLNPNNPNAVTATRPGLRPTSGVLEAHWRATTGKVNGLP